MLQLAVSAIFLFRHKYFPVFSLLYEMSYPVHNNSSRKELLKTVSYTHLTLPTKA